MAKTLFKYTLLGVASILILDVFCILTGFIIFGIARFIAKIITTLCFIAFLYCLIFRK